MPLGCRDKEREEVGLLEPREGFKGGRNQSTDVAVAGEKTFGREREKCLCIGQSSTKLAGMGTLQIQPQWRAEG